MADKFNPFEYLNRERRIVRLLNVIDSYANNKGINVFKHAEALATAAEHASDAWWRAVASEAGCTPVSAETKSGVVTLIRQRAALFKLRANEHRAHEPTSQKTRG